MDFALSCAVMTDLPPPAPLPPTRGALGCFLGILGLGLFGIGTSLAAGGWLVQRMELSPSFGPVVAAIECSLFCAGLALVYRMSMLRLVMLVFLVGLLTWAVTAIKERRDANARGQITPRYQRIPATLAPGGPARNSPSGANGVNPGEAEDTP